MSERHLHATAESLHKAGSAKLLRRWLGRCVAELKPTFYVNGELHTDWSRIEKLISTWELGLPGTEADYQDIQELWHASLEPCGPNTLTAGPVSDSLFSVGEAAGVVIRRGALDRHYAGRVEDVCQRLRWSTKAQPGVSFTKATYAVLLKHRRRMIDIADEIIVQHITGARP